MHCYFLDGASVLPRCSFVPSNSLDFDDTTSDHASLILGLGSREEDRRRKSRGTKLDMTKESGRYILTHRVEETYKAIDTDSFTRNGRDTGDLTRREQPLDEFSLK